MLQLSQLIEFGQVVWMQGVSEFQSSNIGRHLAS